MTAAQLSPWDIDEGIRNAESFFRVLPKLFPDANLFIAQGSRIAEDAAAFRSARKTGEGHRPFRGLRPIFSNRLERCAE